MMALCFGFCTLSYTRSSILLAAAVAFLLLQWQRFPPTTKHQRAKIGIRGGYPPVQQLEKEGEWTRWSRENPVQSEPPPPTQSQYWAEEPSSSESNNYRGSEFDPVQLARFSPNPFGKTGRGILYRNRLDLSVPYLLNKFHQKYLRQAKLLPPRRKSSLWSRNDVGSLGATELFIPSHPTTKPAKSEVCFFSKTLANIFFTTLKIHVSKIAGKQKTKTMASEKCKEKNV